PGRRSRATRMGGPDADGLAFGFEAERTALAAGLDDGRRRKAREPATAIELEDQGAHRENDRGEHEAVVLPPRRRPDRTEELRDLRLREEDVRDRERTLERQAGPNEVAAL